MEIENIVYWGISDYGTRNEIILLYNSKDPKIAAYFDGIKTPILVSSKKDIDDFFEELQTGAENYGLNLKFVYDWCIGD